MCIKLYTTRPTRYNYYKLPIRGEGRGINYGGLRREVLLDILTYIKVILRALIIIIDKKKLS